MINGRPFFIKTCEGLNQRQQKQISARNRRQRQRRRRRKSKVKSQRSKVFVPKSPVNYQLTNSSNLQTLKSSIPKAKAKKVKGQRSKVFVPKSPINYQLTNSSNLQTLKSSNSQTSRSETIDNCSAFTERSRSKPKTTYFSVTVITLCMVMGIDIPSGI